MATERIIMGIDPGTNIMGYGMIKSTENRLTFIDMGVVNLKKCPSQPAKLKMIFEETLALIDKHLPDELAIEAPFFGKNVQSMLKLGRAQGVAIAAAVYRDIPIVEYSPKKIKMAITGSGTASKEQVAQMLKTLLQLKDMNVALDATDGLAAAVCHFFQRVKHSKLGGTQLSDATKISKIPKNKKASSWDAFLKSNPDRIK